jgi:cob(I)alamin adenosyltransferase
MSIVTKTGDKGETGLFGGQRVSKGDVRLHAYGTVDELNAALGIVIADKGLSETLRSQLLRTQNVLFRLGADLATPRENNAAIVPRIETVHIDEIDGWINALETSLPPLRAFILPGGSEASAELHLARTICRRAERWTVELASRSDIGTEAVRYLNRLSDYLFLAAMQANKDNGIEDVQVSYE